MTEEERKQYDRNYYKLNRSKIMASSKKYYDSHKKVILDKCKTIEYCKKQTDRQKKYQIEDKDWWRDRLEKGNLLLDEYRETTYDKANNLHKKWTEEEINFLISNYKKMNYVELALQLGRTYKSILSTLQRYKFGRKNRILTKI